MSLWATASTPMTVILVLRRVVVVSLGVSMPTGVNRHSVGLTVRADEPCPAHHSTLIVPVRSAAT